MFLFFFFSIQYSAQENYSIPQNISEQSKIEFIKNALVDCARNELESIYKKMTDGYVSVEDYKLKANYIPMGLKYAAKIINTINPKSFDVNKLPRNIKIYFSDIDFIFIINEKHMNPYEFYDYLRIKWYIVYEFRFKLFKNKY